MFNPRPKTGPRKKEGVVPLLPVFKKQWEDRQPIDSIPVIESFDQWLELCLSKRMCAVTFKPLHQFDVWQHAHILARQYKRFREEYFNVLLMSRMAHEYYDAHGEEDFLEIGPGAKYVLQYKQQLIQKYYGAH